MSPTKKNKNKNKQEEHKKKRKNNRPPSLNITKISLNQGSTEINSNLDVLAIKTHVPYITLKAVAKAIQNQVILGIKTSRCP